MPDEPEGPPPPPDIPDDPEEPPPDAPPDIPGELPLPPPGPPDLPEGCASAVPRASIAMAVAAPIALRFMIDSCLQEKGGPPEAGRPAFAAINRLYRRPCSKRRFPPRRYRRSREI
jgi:hypothetical protein